MTSNRTYCNPHYALSLWYLEDRGAIKKLEQSVPLYSDLHRLTKEIRKHESYGYQFCYCVDYVNAHGERKLIEMSHYDSGKRDLLIE